MTEVEYFSKVDAIRKQIAQGGAKELRSAEEGLEELRHIYPQRLRYICAEVELMLAHGKSMEECRAVLDYVVQEYWPQDGVADIFEVKARTYDEGSPERRQLLFLSEFHRTGAFPVAPLEALAHLRQAFLADALDDDGLRTLAEQYFEVRNPHLSLVLMMAYCKRIHHLETWADYVLQDAGQLYPHPDLLDNPGYLGKLLTDGASHVFLLIEDVEAVQEDVCVLARALHLLGQQAIILRETKKEQIIPAVETYAISCIQAAETTGGAIVISLDNCRMRDGKRVDVLPVILRLLVQTLETVSPPTLFARDSRMDALHERDALGREIQRLSYNFPDAFTHAFSYAWVGDYCAYISYIYGESVKAHLDAPSTCDFSIVIPVKNSADTLKYTIETCLALDYDGSYEIVLSDNSDADNDSVRAFYETLSDSRVRYYRTPFSLPLSKSFEYALLHARGEFIFSLGADDGIYPWALRYLQKALQDHPEDDLFTWKRGMYFWPRFLQDGHSLLWVPLYDKENTSPYLRYRLYEDYTYYAEHIEETFFKLPLLYINSGCRRRYLKTLLARTGRLLDGISQDIYMGMVNLLTNETFIQFQCPLTIAAQSSASVGGKAALSPDAVESITEQRTKPKPLHLQIGEYVMRRVEWKNPIIGESLEVVLHMMEDRLQETGASHVEEDGKAYAQEYVFDSYARQIRWSDVRFERHVAAMLLAASMRSTALLAHCEQLCKVPYTSPRALERDKVKYEIPKIRGFQEEGKELVLDANAFACKNIVDAVALSVKMLHL